MGCKSGRCGVRKPTEAQEQRQLGRMLQGIKQLDFPIPPDIGPVERDFAETILAMADRFTADPSTLPAIVAELREAARTRWQGTIVGLGAE